MKIKSEISFISPNEIDEATKRMASVRFDCLVRMFDFGEMQTTRQMPFRERKPLPPQYFKSEIKLTMELIEDTDPCILGRMIKDTYFELQQHINQYTNA